MYVKFDDLYSDTDMCFLEDTLKMLDTMLLEVNLKIKKALNNSVDPDAVGLFDKGEYIIGMGFAACQRYLSSTFGFVKIKKLTALKVGPIHKNGEPIAIIINAAANYWKHSDEWDTTSYSKESESEMVSINLRNPDFLNNQQKVTIRTIETVTSWADYTCANVLSSLTKTGELKLSELIPILEEWRNQLDETVSNGGKR